MSEKDREIFERNGGHKKTYVIDTSEKATRLISPSSVEDFSIPSSDALSKGKPVSK